MIAHVLIGDSHPNDGGIRPHWAVQLSGCYVNTYMDLLAEAMGALVEVDKQCRMKSCLSVYMRR